MHGVVDMKKLIIFCVVILLGIYFGSVLDTKKSENPYYISFQGTDGTTDEEFPDDDVCIPECIAYDCTRTTTFKFKIDITITAKQRDKYSVVPASQKKGEFPLRAKTFKDLDKISWKRISDGDKKFMPIWRVGNKYYVYGDSTPKDKFIFLGVNPNNKDEYVLWENGISLNEVKDKECNFYDGVNCRNLPNLVNMEVPYDWLDFIFKIKYHTECSEGSCSGSYTG